MEEAYGEIANGIWKITLDEPNWVYISSKSEAEFQELIQSLDDEDNQYYQKLGRYCKNRTV
jgi:hypothetical protein